MPPDTETVGDDERAKVLAWGEKKSATARKRKAKEGAAAEATHAAKQARVQEKQQAEQQEQLGRGMRSGAPKGSAAPATAEGSGASAAGTSE